MTVQGVCPCCSRKLRRGRDLTVYLDGNVMVRDGVVVRVTPRVAELVSILREAYPSAVPSARIIARMYGPVEEPDTSLACLRNYVTAARKSLRRLGAGIQSNYRRGYSLELPDVGHKQSSRAGHRPGDVPAVAQRRVDGHGVDRRRVAPLRAL